MNMKIGLHEKVFKEHDGFQCHASSFVVLDDGRIFCVFFGGTREGHDDVCIYGSVRSCDGKWSEIKRISEDDGIPHWNPVLLKCRDEKIIMFYKVGKSIDKWYTKVKTVYESDDILTLFENAESFELIPNDETGGRGPVKNKAVYLSNGDILAPGSTEQGEWKAFFDLSHDNGAAWTRSDDIRLDFEIVNKYEISRKTGIIQPSVWESDRGNVHALMRSTEGYIYRTDSSDCGRTWSIPYSSALPNNNSGIDLVKLPSHGIALAYNPVSDNWGKRTPLSIAYSDDNGFTWEKKLDIEASDGEYSYPAILFNNKKIYVSYTWNRKSIAFAEIDVEVNL